VEKNIKNIYRNLYTKYSNSLKKAEYKLRKLSILRLLSFLSAFISPLLLYPYHNWIAVLSSILFLVLFLFLIRRYGKAEKNCRLLKNYITINKNEQKAIENDFSAFPAGNEYKNSDHEFTYDLDIFGDHSLFRFLNRTSTHTGNEELASWLTRPLLNSKEILERQEAVKELASKLEWRQKLLAYGELYRENKDDVETLNKWGEKEIDFSKKKLYKILGVVVPSVTLATLFFSIINIIPFSVFNTLAGIQILLLYIKRKEVVFFFRTFGKRSAILSKYSELFQIVEDETFQAPLLKRWQNTLTSYQATKRIKELNREIALFDARLNIFAGIILNILFLWDINRCLSLTSWHIKNRLHLVGWMETLAKFDALISLANYSFNYPSNAFPKPKEQNTEFILSDVGHPLIPVSERVNNTFSISGEGNFAIITGANMAGKSTFLRTVGVNLVLSMSGAPVCAKEFEFTPMPLITHMRTDDNLSRHESYFFAELRRLKAIKEKLTGNKKAFIILDEILRGTNSEDKLKGSWKYMEQLIEKSGIGIVATHDLKLTELIEKHPDKIENLCFEIELSDKGLFFDYKLFKGVTKTMNATFLMKQMEII
jgi:DNA mismatch repair ATPase MutS